MPEDQVVEEVVEAEEEVVEEEVTEEVEPKVEGETETETEEEAEDTPLWMQEEKDEAEPEPESDSVPTAAHINLKKKLKGTIREQNQELEQLRSENEKLKQLQAQAPSADNRPKRPNVDDFGTTEEFNAALDKYETDLVQFNASVVQQTAEQKTLRENYIRRVDTAVNDHYDRAGKLVKEASIEPDVFRAADVNVKQALEDVMPAKGEIIFNETLMRLGEGSEKVMLYLGRNKKALSELTGSLREDNSGLSAMLYLGKLMQKINGPVSKTSRAPAPAPNLKAAGGGQREATLQKQYNAAHAKKDGSKAYAIKKKAKAAGFDTSKW